MRARVIARFYVLGIECILVKNYCAYIGIWYNGYVVADWPVDTYEIDVHGGVTWEGVAPKFSPGVLIGYDCNHMGDTAEECDLGYNIQQVTRLAEQVLEQRKGVAS